VHIDGFESLNSDVQQVVTIKIYLVGPMLIFQRWEATRSEGPAIRSHHAHVAAVTQEVKIALVGTIPMATGKFSLQFSKIFERPPLPGTSEGDIVFNSDDLLYIAKDVWRLLGEMPWE
jgi:hypothetical protein